LASTRKTNTPCKGNNMNEIARFLKLQYSNL
jgi:hypothetical protein